MIGETAERQMHVFLKLFDQVDYSDDRVIESAQKAFDLIQSTETIKLKKIRQSKDHEAKALDA